MKFPYKPLSVETLHCPFDVLRIDVSLYTELKNLNRFLPKITTEIPVWIIRHLPNEVFPELKNLQELWCLRRQSDFPIQSHVKVCA